MIADCDDRERERLERIDIKHAQEMHEQRVALCRAMDLLNGAPLPHHSPLGTFPPVRH